jgi:superfamily I DNA and/or RNA helicase
MLTVQYRMHPAISAFPNVTFYGGRLVDGEVRSAALYEGGREGGGVRSGSFCGA